MQTGRRSDQRQRVARPLNFTSSRRSTLFHQVSATLTPHHHSKHPIWRFSYLTSSPFLPSSSPPQPSVSFKNNFRRDKSSDLYTVRQLALEPTCAHLVAVRVETVAAIVWKWAGSDRRTLRWLPILVTVSTAWAVCSFVRNRCKSSAHLFAED